MNVLDIILIIPIVWLMYRGFTKGLIIEFASLLALILGIWAAIHFSYYTGDILNEYFEISKRFLSIISFVITFIAVVIVVYFIGRIIEKFIDILALGFINKLFGAVFGIAKAALILSLLILIINSFDSRKSIITDKLREGSMLYSPIETLVPSLIPKLDLENLDENMDKIKPDNLMEL